MGNFIKAVRSGDVTGPLRRGFKKTTWQSEYARLNGDEQDKNLLECGLLLHDKANAIRDQLRLTFKENHKATTKVRSFVAMSNHELLSLKMATHREFERIVQAQRASDPATPIVMHELAAAKLELPIGTAFTPDEVIQSMVDGLELPLKRILEGDPDLSGVPQYGRVEWSDVAVDLNLGVLYSHVESLWDECLWNGYKVTRSGSDNAFSVADTEWVKRHEASRARYQNLAHEFALHVQQFEQRMRRSGREESPPLLSVKAVIKEGRRQRIKLIRSDPLSRHTSWLQTMKAYASEPYYADLLIEPQVDLQGATLHQLLMAWTVVSETANHLQQRAEEFGISATHAPSAWAPNFAPVVEIDALVTAIAQALHISRAQSRAIVEFLVFRGKSDEELWAQPLIPVSGEAVTPLFAATSAPNLRRLIDVWMRQLGIDLAKRGPAFETHVRASVSDSISRSVLLRTTSICIDRSVQFTPKDERAEEIDLVVVVGNVVMLGEAKCFVEPVEAKQVAMHREKVIGAVNQIRRKADTVTRNKEAFRLRLSQLGFELPDEFTVVPVVILNSAIHCGVPVDGIPVVDEYILSVFFQGEFIEAAIKDGADNELRVVKKRVLYGSSAEASSVLANFLQSPPQMQRLIEGLRDRWVPIRSLHDADWGGQFLTFECAVQDTSFRSDALPGDP